MEAAARAVRRYDFDVISVYEDLGDQSPMYPLMTLANYAVDTNTKYGRIGPACVVVPKYNTMEPIVGDISRLDELSDGRAYLGLAPGSWMEQVGLAPATVQQLREAADVSRYLLEKREDGFEGQYYKVEPGFKVNYPTPLHRVSLLIGAWGPNMAALAGEIADEIKVGGSANPLLVPVMRDRVNVGVQRAGREPDDIGIVFGAVTVVDEDRNTALAVARERAVVYINVVGDKDPTAMADFGEEIASIKKATSVGDIETAVKHLPDELTRRFMFAGTPEDIIKQTEEIFKAGASRVEFGSPHGVNQVDGINLLGEKVLPYFK